MNTTTLSLAHVSDDELVVRVKSLVREERAATAALLVHLAEMEERKLHCREGCASLFAYCVEVLHLSEPAAYRRIKAARLGKRFPIVLTMLAEGSIHLAALDVLAAHLTDANHKAVLAEACHKTKCQVEEIAARLRPFPDVPASVRRLPGPKPVRTELLPVLLQAETMLWPGQPGPERAQGAPGSEQVQSWTALAATPAEDRNGREGRPAVSNPGPERPPVIAPLSPSRYRIQFTAGAETYRKLRQVRELLRHQVPDGDPAVIVDTALTVLLEKLLREKTGAVTRPRRKKPPAPKSDEGHGKLPAPGTGEARRRRVAAGKPSESRHIPAAVKREVWRRDGGRCAFIAGNGRRCSSRGPLEFHHVEPYMLGGRATIANIALRCRTHNAYEGERQFSSWRARVLGKKAPNTPETLPGESCGQRRESPPAG